MANLIPVEEAQARILDTISTLATETVSLRAATGRALADDVRARLTHPPADISAMDGYALKAEDSSVGTCLKLVGESAAGKGFPGVAGAGETVRIFTGAPLPAGTDTIIIQENVTARDTQIILNEAVHKGANIRRKGLDFSEGEIRLHKGQRLSPFDIALAAAMNVPELPVCRRPLIAFFSTGNELVRPGEEPGPDQIVSSNNDGLAALIEAAGGIAVDLGIAPDNEDAIRETARQARRCHMLVTIGGASVGDHDLVHKALKADGLVLDFWRIAMRPGKPLMFGRYGPIPMLGLPGNPVSALICALLFLVPAIKKFQGMTHIEPLATLPVATFLKANDKRQDYIRARLENADGIIRVRPFDVQDSSMLSLLSAADCLIVRPPHATATEAGEFVKILPLRF